MAGRPPHHVPWSPFAAVWVYALQLAAVTVFGALLGQAVRADTLSEPLARVLLLPLTSVTAAVMTLVVVAARHPGELWRLRGPVPPRWRDAGRGIGYGILAYLAVPVVLGWVLDVAVRAGGGELPVIQPTFRAFAANPVAAPVFFTSVVLLAPVGEELLFRGMLFQSLRTRIGVWPGIGLSAIAFGLVHLSATAGTGANLVVLVTVFALGMIFAGIFHRTGSLVVVVSAHCTFNAMSAVLLVTSQNAA